MLYEDSFPPNDWLRRLIVETIQRGVLIHVDDNGHHRIWRKSNTNLKGDLILEFLIEFKLSILNIGDEPTSFN